MKIKHRDAIAETNEENLNKIIEKWQTSWDRSIKGRITHEFFPSIRERLKIPLNLNHYAVQMFSGHGNFRGKLYTLNLSADPGCLHCNFHTEYPPHIIFDCNRAETEREFLKETVVETNNPWPCPLSTFVKTKRIYDAFVKFATAALSIQPT